MDTLIKLLIFNKMRRNTRESMRTLQNWKSHTNDKVNWEDNRVFYQNMQKKRSESEYR